MGNVVLNAHAIVIHDHTVSYCTPKLTKHDFSKSVIEEDALQVVVRSVPLSFTGKANIHLTLNLFPHLKLMLASRSLGKLSKNRFFLYTDII